jgi:hypothetical protein
VSLSPLKQLVMGYVLWGQGQEILPGERREPGATFFLITISIASLYPFELRRNKNFGDTDWEEPPVFGGPLERSFESLTTNALHPPAY